MWRAAVITAAATLATAHAHAYCRTTQPRTPNGLCERGAPVAWPVGCVGLALNRAALTVDAARGQDLAPLLRRHLPWAAEAWSNAPCGAGSSLRLVAAPEVDLDDGIGFDGVNTVSVNRRWRPDPYHLPGVLAVTVISTDVASGALLDADVELNARSMENALGREFTEGPPVWGSADLPTLLLHELGHVAGLNHSDRRDAVMAAGAGDVERQRRALTDDDARGLCATYPVSDARPRPRAGCEAEAPRAPTGMLTGGTGCAASPGAGAPSRCAALLVAALAQRCLRRRKEHCP